MLIDNIFSNNLENSFICGNIVTETMDHFTQVCIVASHPNPLNYSKQRKKIRDYSSFSANRFLSKLQEIEWSNSSDNDTNQSFTTFYKKINCLVNKHAPMKTLSKRRGKILSKPWITKGIRTSIRIKNNLFFNADWEHYKLYRNKITSLTRQSKKNYYERYFEENINNSKETWRGINDIISTQFVPFFEQKLQGLSRTHFAFFKDSTQCKKEILSFLVVPQHEQFYPEGLSY